MTNAKPTTGAPTAPLVLTVAELSYLLQTLGATTLWGGDSRPLFPTDAAIKEAQLVQGLADLKRHNWLRLAEDSRPGQERWNLDRNLLQMVATIADPVLVIVTTSYPATQVKEIVCHYITSDAIVELVATAVGTYHLLALPTSALLWQRLRETLPLPVTGEGDGVAFTLTESEFRHLAQLAKTQSGGIDVAMVNGLDPALTPLYAIIATARPLAEIELGRVARRQLLAGHNLTLLVAAEQVWLFYYATATTILIQSATQQAILMCLQAWWAELIGLSEGDQ